jgi:RNA polymerase sigma-70 factor, ECF subfamily
MRDGRERGNGGYTSDELRLTLDRIYRSDSALILATLIRLLDDFDLAEEALQEAFRVAIEKWPLEGVPSNPVSWLISAGKFRAIDTLRRSKRFSSLEETPEPASPDDPGDFSDDGIEDDRLRLIFVCCHPSIPPEGRIALTLREVCGLTTEEIAHAYLVPPSTLAQRIVRAKAKITEARIPYRIPLPREFPERLHAVLRVIYLVYNEGYAASSGSSITRADLSEEAIRLGRLLAALLPDTEALGLLALMLLQESRRAARTAPKGDIVLLEDQDRSLWRKDFISEGSELVRRAMGSGPSGPYTLQAAIARIHATSLGPGKTDWNAIILLYDLLLQVESTPVIKLNRAVAVAMRDGPERGLAIIDDLLLRGYLSDYQLAHSARADLCRRAGRVAEAKSSYMKALALARLEPERRFLERRLQELG